MKRHLLAPALLLTLTAPACAEQKDNQAQAQPSTGVNAQAKADPANPYMPAEMAMHDKMMAAKGADDGETWTRKMIEHHRGALTMSQIALKESDDPMVRQMAQKTIDMQTKDIAELNKMLTDKGLAAQ
ncbi:MAG: DUF305 domain-containing protein [Sphingomonadaceae bacterium]|uniref:DUF305 domain-containing protein n=1 Tax=Novosphingobium sp. APW14 TaxID=3077237 RepID=UPI0022BD965D|nr:DUF305 domain-containing protein [Novosphingobium sp. APW14]MCZ8324340.1 DUF305 domain-containing protein [Sphingomonadaceae bacterium]MDT9014114.1 DUF305 domain-containing protein [Novosphingobium sp. APW14]